MAERDAAKRAPAKSGAVGAGGAGGAAAARVDVNVDPLGDWRTQTEDPAVLIRSLGYEVVKQRATEGEGEAQFSQGCLLVSRADGGFGTPLGGSGRSPQADVGLELCTAQFPVAHYTETHRCGHVKISSLAGANPKRRRARRFLRRQQGKGTRTLCMCWEGFTA